MKITGKNIFIREIHSSIDQVNEVEELIQEIHSSFEIPKELQFHIRLALVEAVNNAMVHGNSLSSNKTVIITCLRFSDFMRFSIKDEGTGFNFEEAYSNQIPESELSTPNGRGIFLIHQFADSVQFIDRGRVIQIDFFNAT